MWPVAGVERGCTITERTSTAVQSGAVRFRQRYIHCVSDGLAMAEWRPGCAAMCSWRPGRAGTCATCHLGSRSQRTGKMSSSGLIVPRSGRPRESLR